MKLIRLFAIAMVLFIPLSVFSQSTFSQVYQLLQTKCSGAGCHDGSDATFSVSLSETDLYNALVNVTPQNAVAAAKGDKLVTPGYSARSFLLRKMAHGISTPLVVEAGEGNYQPEGQPKLPDNEIELVRQWILFGALQTGNVVDTSLVNTYYREGGVDDTYANHEPPAVGEGFQLYVGKIFVPANTELEYYIKYDPRITQNTEVYKYQTLMPDAAHHFVIFKFFPGGASNYPDGLRPLSQGSHGDTGDGIGSGPGFREEVLPDNSAYFWPKSSILDLNLHIRNNSTSILATDLYVNIYTQPVGTAQHYMLVRNFPNFDIVIPQDGAVHEFTVHSYDTAETRMWNIWMLYSHTHRYGTDYDIWFRNVNGTKGDQIYEGFYNQEYTFNQGFYGWGVDVPVRYFENPFLEVDPRLGFIHTAKFINTAGPDTVWWGDTSLDEMMVMGFQFTYGDSLGVLPTSVHDELSPVSAFNVFPNPITDEFAVSFVLPQDADVKMELTNVLGETVVIFDEYRTAGNYLQEIDLGNSATPGLYALTVQTGQGAVTKKVILK